MKSVVKNALGFLFVNSRGSLAFILAIAVTAATHAASSNVARLDRENLLQYRSATSSIEPVRTTADWQKRRAEILAGMQQIMGPLPGAEKRVPLDIRVENETDCGSYLRREITYVAEPGGRAQAFLLLPKAVLDGKTQRIGILALMGTDNTDGNRVLVGLGRPAVRPGRNYGEELAWRGHVVIVPAYPHLASYKPDLKALGYRSGTMKAIWDNIRALDVLESLPGVAKNGFAAIGLSLGGHNSIFTAVFDERIKVVVSACGFDSFLDYYAEKPEMWNAGQGWTQERYMPALAAYGNRKQEIPFDFHELIGALAPRPFLAIAPRGDSNFKWQSVDRVIGAAWRVYQLHNVSEHIVVEHPEGAHDFPDDMRAKAYAWLERWLK